MTLFIIGYVVGVLTTLIVCELIRRAPDEYELWKHGDVARKGSNGRNGG